MKHNVNKEGIAMDIQKIFQKIKAGWLFFWRWLKPYLSQFHQWRKRIWKKYQINKIILLIGLIVVLIASIYLFYLAKSANVETLQEGLKTSTTIYDKNGENAGTLYGQKGTYVELDQISPSIQDAVISTEDRRFYEHHGFDVKGIARAVVGRFSFGMITAGGGSTITQQLAKNAYLTQEQTMDRKARELFLAIEIEKKYSKDEILTMYLNNSYFGNGVWGVEDASHKYFGVSAAEVTPGEAAMLVGMLKGPGIYNPIDNPENAINRRDTVLALMVDNGKLAQADADAMAAVPLDQMLYDNYAGTESGYQYPYYFDAVIDEAVNVLGFKEEDILNKGYKIYTSLDQSYQQAMEQTYANDGLFPANAEDGAMVQSGSIALDPKTGGVQAVVGRRGEHVFRGFNFATQARRSPGSSIKPLIYTAALESGFKPDSILQDTPQEYYDAENYSRTYSGEVPMYQALAESLNLPAVWTLHEIGIDKGFAKVEKFGLDLSDADKYYGLALGGLETGASPLTMANAYSVFANGGKQAEAHFITKIVDSTGAVLVDKTEPKTKQITTETVADEMTSMLLGVFSSGTGQNADPYGYVMAGKTGTTETSFDSNLTNDQWVVGYTPDVVMATWMGFEETSETHYLEGTSAEYASTVFNDQASRIMPLTQQTSFTVADAYTTGGKLMAAEDVPSSSEWQDTVNQGVDKAKESAKTIGDQIKRGFDKAKDSLSGFWNDILGQ